jgi:protein tyrosine kinase modulator
LLPGKKYTPADVVPIVSRYRWFIIVPTLALAAAAGVGSRFLPDKYRSETIVLVVPPRLPDPSVSSSPRTEERVQAIREQMLSRSRLEGIITELDISPQERAANRTNVVVDQMRENISMRAVRENAFSVSFVASDPTVAQRVTERLVGLFDEQTTRAPEGLAADTQALEADLEAARERLSEQENKVEDYRRRFAAELPEQVGSNLQVIRNAQRQIRNLEQSLIGYQDRRKAVEGQLADTGTNASAPAAEAQVPGSPATSGATQQLEAIDSLIADNLAEQQRLRGTVAWFRAKVEAAPSRATDLQAMTRDYEVLQEHYQDLVKKVEASQTAVTPERPQRDEELQVLDPPTIPDRPFTPNRPLITATGAASGFVLGFALVFLLELRDRTLRSPADVLVSCGVPVVATLTTIRPPRRRALL